ncbi:DUF2330 domain-containing protein [Acidipropionibacterium jensenii]|uniref:DUF2330 domain-containing protein n=1 Tax=Acidipropionibacterium jensenii TaxID=1749 RepID=UPI001586A8E1|nr:DUF2330 domain-containing protein [Acidipropionibacterium jensenii]
MVKYPGRAMGSRRRGLRDLRWPRLLLAVLLLASGLTVAPSQVAVACACGGIATDPGSQTRVSREAAVIVFDGRTERIDMTLSMTSSDVRSAAWLMPAPVGTRLSLGATGVIGRLDAAAAPKVVTSTKLRLVPGLTARQDRDQATAPRADSGVAVESRVRIGPFIVTTLSGSRAEALDDWLVANGFTTRANLLPVVQSYLDAGWRINAVKLVPEGAPTLGSTLPPLRMTFATTTAVYPMKMSGLAAADQQVRIHLLAASRMVIDVQAAPSSPLGLDFTGLIDPATAGLDKGMRPDGKVWLTSWSGRLGPRTITDDYTFRGAKADEPFRREVVQVRYIDIPVSVLALPVIGLLVIAGLGLAYRRQMLRVSRSGRPR